VESSLQRHHKADGPSRALSKLGRRLSAIRGPVLDVPCGYGRNAFWVRSLGHDVVCVDKDREALQLIDDHISATVEENTRTTQLGKLTTLSCDLFETSWPFEAGKFGAVINIDFVALDLLEKFTFSLRVGGLLFFETFANRGGNFLQLPKQGQVRKLLEIDYDFEMYREKKAGPAHIDAVTVCLLGRKRGSLDRH
jgi:SAM-dependent methyltransferase